MQDEAVVQRGLICGLRVRPVPSPFELIDAAARDPALQRAEAVASGRHLPLDHGPAAWRKPDLAAEDDAFSSEDTVGEPSARLPVEAAQEPDHVLRRVDWRARVGQDASGERVEHLLDVLDGLVDDRLHRIVDVVTDGVGDRARVQAIGVCRDLEVAGRQ